MPLRSLVPVAAAVGCCTLLVCAPGRAQAPDPSPDDAAFAEWLSGVRAEAMSRGIGEATVTRALDGAAPVPIVLERDRTQAEFTLTLNGYLRRRLTPAMVRTARTHLARHRTLLRRVDAEYGVDPATIISIWGLESNFGRFSGVRPTIPVLVTLAYEPRRAAMFREELFHALEILDEGAVDLARLRGSWAGAMGQPQFLPSSYQRFAVDFDRDGRKDIWTTPADVFASMANYLKAHGWTRGERWGREVRVPAAARAKLTEATTPRTEGCPASLVLTAPQPVRAWKRLGVVQHSGAALPASSLPASLLQLDGRAFLVYRNYEAVLGYNCAHRYALSVTLLADRIAAR